MKIGTWKEFAWDFVHPGDLGVSGTGQQRKVHAQPGSGQTARGEKIEKIACWQVLGKGRTSDDVKRAKKAH